MTSATVIPQTTSEMMELLAQVVTTGLNGLRETDNSPEYSARAGRAQVGGTWTALACRAVERAEVAHDQLAAGCKTADISFSVAGSSPSGPALFEEEAL